MTTSRIRDLTSFIVMDVLEKASEMEKRGIHVIHLEVGEPDFDIPSCVRSSLADALEKNTTHYTHSLGIPELRDAICSSYQENYGVSIDPDQVAVTSGSSPAILLALSVILEPADQVIISDPHYACYPNFIRFLNAVPVPVPVYEADGFQYRPDKIQEQMTGKTRAIIINSPSNPTGTLLSPDRMKTIAGFAPWIISDEIYHGLVYEGEEHSMLEYSDRVFVINGFSKLYAMTGLRLGYLIAPKPFLRAIQKLQQNFFICANSLVQQAAIIALKAAKADIANMKSTYNRRRKLMIRRLKELGFSLSVEPTGAFYVFADARHLSSDSYKLAFDILEKAHVGVAPGIDFGKNGEGFLRFSYANSIENINAGMDRLKAYLEKYHDHKKC